MQRILIATIVFLGATGIMLIGSSAGQLAGMLVAVALAVTVSALSPRLLRTRPAQPAMASAEGWRHVAIEMARSRRHRHSMAVIRVEGSGTAPASRIDETELRPRLRVVDQLLRMDDDLYVLLPQADAGTVRALEARLRADLPGVAVRIRAAIFPDDGITIGSLRRRLMTSETPAAMDGQSGAALVPWRSNASSSEQAS